MSTRSKKGTPSKEIPDAANNKIVELEGELARQKTATAQETGELRAQLARQQTVQDQETMELRELADRKTEHARQHEEENRRLAAQLAELQRKLDSPSVGLTTPQVPLPPIPRALAPTTTSTPSGIWDMPGTANQGDGPARSLGPALQDEDHHALEEKGTVTAEKALAALEQLGGSLFGGNDGHIPPSFSSANSAFLKHISAAPDGPIDPVTLAQHMMTAVSLFFGTELNSNDFEKFSCEQISVALVAQKLTLLHAMHGVVGQGVSSTTSR